MRNLRLLFLVGLATGFISGNLFVSSQATFSTTDDMYLEGRTSGDLPIDDEDGGDDGSGSGSGDYDFTHITYQEEMLWKFLNSSQTTVSKEMVPTQPQPSAAFPLNPTTTAAESQNPSTKEKDTETTPFILPNGDTEEEEVAGPTVDWFRESTSPSSTTKPPRETTASKSTIDITVINHTDKDNSLESWDVSTPRNRGDEVKIQEIENDLLAENGRGSKITSENMWEKTEVLAVISCGVIGLLFAVFLLLLLAYRMKKKDEGSYNLGDTKVSTTAYQKAPTKEFYA
ncbi:syndecan-2-like isoform X2 [Anoplopoma fimbria]|uniref:syndecan-2-like isoform X2 n=1 Tax=Anoplopoma fimbria TaxID=229290 RepID=UPI0023ECEB73|nr:syndecan-2-like isoform X2 [Anoplopoma fimbria]